MHAIQVVPGPPPPFPHPLGYLGSLPFGKSDGPQSPYLSEAAFDVLALRCRYSARDLLSQIS